ncbi:MAG TPA: alpha/beta hydrolase, partial [Hyphomicrobiales bacterium]
KRYIADVKAPILIMHGTNDRTIPIQFGKALFEAAPEPKKMEVIEGAGHSDIYDFGALEMLQRFLRSHRQKAEAEAPAERHF